MTSAICVTTNFVQTVRTIPLVHLELVNQMRLMMHQVVFATQAGFAKTPIIQRRSVWTALENVVHVALAQLEIIRIVRRAK